MAERDFDRGEFEAWLKTHPADMAVCIAARSALRVFPLIWSVLESEAEERAGTIVLPLFRAMAAPRAAVVYPARAAVARGAEIAAAAADALERDCSAIEVGRSASDLGKAPLWPEKMPDEIARGWSNMCNRLLVLEQDWGVWANWYDARLEGLPESEDLEIARLSLPAETWEQGPKVVNAEIKRLEEEFRDGKPLTWGETAWGEGVWGGEEEAASLEESASLEGSDAEVESETEKPLEIPKVPAPKSASLEPVWKNRRLILPNSPAEADFDAIENALTALKRDFEKFVHDLEREAGNAIDSRIVEYIHNFSRDLPEAVPSNDDLFSIAQNEIVLQRLAAQVASEWPDMLVLRFQGLNLQFGRVLRRFPEWRNFISDPDAIELTDEQIKTTVELSAEVAGALASDPDHNPVSSEIPEQLKAMNQDLNTAEQGLNLPVVVEHALNQAQARNILESINNTLKRVFEAAVVSGVFLKDQSIAAGKKVLAGAKKQVGKEWEDLGASAVKWLFRFVKTYAVGCAVAVGGAKLGLFAKLAVMFPEIYGWMEGFFPFLTWI